MKYPTLIALLIAAACTPAEPIATSPGFGTAIGGATTASTATVSTRGAFPVYTADPGRVARASNRDSVISAYASANRGSLFGVDGAPFQILDVTGVAFRVDGAEGSIGFVSDVRRPFSVAVAGSDYDRDVVTRTVSQKLAEMAGCTWDGRTQTQFVNGSIKRFAAYMNC